jgi:simple sugar transport system ATP-binding protein
MDFNIAENSVMGLFNKPPFCKKIRIRFDEVNKHAEMIVKKYDVRTPGIATPSRLLSGGNQQKLILGREIEKNPEVFVAVQPTRGLDIAATEFVQEELLNQRDRGTAIIYISTELEEIFKMSDKVLVLSPAGNMDHMTSINWTLKPSAL